MNNYLITPAIYLLFILETLALSACMGQAGIYGAPILFFGSSLALAGLAIRQGSRATAAPSPPDTHDASPDQARDWTSLLFAAIAFTALVAYARTTFYHVPLDPGISDVFPQVLTAARAWLRGEYAYQIVQLPTYTMNNTYLPMQWLPFCATEYLGKDPRWIPVAAWSVAFLTLIYQLRLPFLQHRATPLHRLLLGLGLCLPAWAAYSFIRYNMLDYGLTLELLPAAYYVGLCVGLLSGSAWAMGLALGACLLSRFSILFFLPFVAYYIATAHSRQKMYRAFGIAATFVLLVFVLPFMTQDPQLPAKIVGNYDGGALSEWRGQAWQAPGTEPHQLSRGLGMAIFFKKAFEPDLVAGIRWLKRTEIALCLSMTLLAWLLYRRYGTTPRRKQWLLLGGLKLYFVFFYHFVLIPYPYLFLMPMTISAIIVLQAAKELSEPTPP